MGNCNPTDKVDSGGKDHLMPMGESFGGGSEVGVELLENSDGPIGAQDVNDQPLNLAAQNCLS